MRDDKTPMFILWESIEDGVNFKLQLTAGAEYSMLAVHLAGSDTVTINLFLVDEIIFHYQQPFEIPRPDGSAVAVLSMVNAITYALTQVIRAANDPDLIAGILSVVGDNEAGPLAEVERRDRDLQANRADTLRVAHLANAADGITE